MSKLIIDGQQGGFLLLPGRVGEDSRVMVAQVFVAGHQKTGRAAGRVTDRVLRFGATMATISLMM